MLVERAKNEILIRITSDIDDHILQDVLDLIHSGERESKFRRQVYPKQKASWWSNLSLKLF